MGHDKFFKDFRTKLENRKIVPSDTAWERLETQLMPQNNTQKRRKSLYWIAASTVILLMSSIYFMNFNTEKKIPSVVENEVPDRLFPAQRVDTDIEKNTLVVQEEAIKEETIPLKKDPILQKSTHLIQEVIANNTSEEISRNQTISKSFEDGKVEEVVAKIQKLQQNNKTATDAEINALLAQAQQEINLRKKLSDTSGKVDAMALLAGVEEELDQSFKNKVFEALKEGFFKVRSAVAERNN